MKLNKSKRMSQKQFILFTINYIVGFGFIATISGVINLGTYGLIVLFVTALITFTVALVFSKLASSYPDNYGGSYHYARVAFNKTTSFFVGWNQFIQGPILAATAPLFLASAFNYVSGITDEALLGIRIGSILFFIFLVLISTLGLHLNKIIIFLSALVKWIVLILGIGIALYFTVIENAYATNFITSKVTPFLIISTIISFMYAFGGIEDVSAMVADGEFKNFRKVLLISFAIILFFYFASYIILIGIDGAKTISNFSFIYNLAFSLTGVIIFVVGLIFNGISSRISISIASSRKIIPLAEDKYLPKFLIKKNKKNEFQNAILFAAGITLISLIIFWLIPFLLNLENFFNSVIELGTVAFLVQYFMTLLAALVLDKKKIIKKIHVLEKILYVITMIIIFVIILFFLIPPILNEPWLVKNTIVIASYFSFILIGYLLYLINYLSNKKKSKILKKN